MAPVRKSQRTSHVMRAADTSAQVPITVDQKSKIPVEMEKLELPLNTFSPKKPFKAKIKSVERIVGPKATGETCHIVLETNGEIPFWEGQSYGVIPPVSLPPRPRGLFISVDCKARQAHVYLSKLPLQGLDRVDFL